MLRNILIALVLFVSAPVMAQDLTAEQRAACKGDYAKFCRGITPGGGRIIVCLAKQNDNLSEACRKVLADFEKKK